MAEGNSPSVTSDEMNENDDLVRKLPSIPSSDEVAALDPNVAHVPERQGSIDERLHRLRTVTQGVIAARKFRRASSIQGKYVAITPNERDNLEHIQHMTEDITARLDKLRDQDPAPAPDDEEEAGHQSHGDLYLPAPVQGKFVQFVPFDASRPTSLHPSHGADVLPRSDISPLPPLPPVDSFAFLNGDEGNMDDGGENDEAEGAFVTASLERRLQQLSENRTQ